MKTSKKNKVSDGQTASKVPSGRKATAATTPAASAATPAPAPIATAPAATKPTIMAPTRIAVIYYSTYGHVAQLAKQELEGANSVEGVEATLLRIPETLSKEILEKMHAPGPDESVPEITTHALTEYDGYLIGVPTRYGSPAAQFKTFWDATGGLWTKGALAGKAASMFFSTASQGGGQETTALTAMTQFTHHGIIHVPLGYTAPNGLQFGLDEVTGGSAWGAGTFAGPTGARQPTEKELAIARHQGSYFAAFVKKLAGNA